MKQRIFLLIGYWAVSAVVVFIFIGHGDGSAVPFAILFSWPGYVAKQLSPYLDTGFPGINAGGVLILLYLFVLYYLGLLGLVSKLSREKNSARFVLGIIHLSGGLVFMLTFSKESILPPGILDSEPFILFTALWYIASYVISVALTLFWLKLDWRQAKIENLTRDSDHNARN